MLRQFQQLVAAACAACLLAGCVQPSAREGASAPAAGNSPAGQFISTVKRTVLPNGLTVLIREQKGTGIVAVNTHVKAGYFHEPDEVAGMAHLFEHMFFKGSRAYPGPESIDNAISGAGGRSNAGTIYDRTIYYTVLPKESLITGIEVQADAIAHPLFDAAELKKEAEVVIEESNRKLDNAGPVALERMWATAFTQHRFKRWRIGSNEVLRNIRRDNLMAFFETLYRPENIIVAITGDLDADETLAAVKRTYGAIPRGQLKKERGPKEPLQQAFRFGRSEGDIKEGHTVFGWHTVAENHADEVALEVLAGVLGQGRSSRLFRGAVGPKAASTAGSFHFTFEDVGVFTITSTHPETNREEVERRVMGEVERMKQFGPTDYELAQAKHAARVQFIGQMDTANEQAEVLAQFESRGSYRDIATQLARLQAMSAAEVREAARRYLLVDKLTLYHYQAKGSPAVTPAAALERIRTAASAPVTAPVGLALPDLRNSVAPASAESARKTFTLSNGAQLLIQERIGAPLVATGIFFRGGRTQESAANAGITRLMQAAMRRGTASRTGEAIDREIEFLGTQIGVENSADGFGFSFKTVSELYEPALAILADVVLNPGFPEDGVTREKALQTAALRRSMDNAFNRPMQLYHAAAFPNHPYGLGALGTEATIAAIDKASLQAWWKAGVVADRAMIVVVGNVKAEDAHRVIEARLGTLPRGEALAAVPPPQFPKAVKENTEQRDRKQTAIVIGFPTVGPAHPDWATLKVTQALASGLSGTFFVQLRSRQQLAYVVHAAAEGFARDGTFYGYLAGEAGKEGEARASLLREFRKLQGEGVAAEPLERAKRFYVGNVRISRETNDALVTEYGRDFILGLPIGNLDRTLEAVPRVGVADVHAVARKYFSGDNYVFAAVRGSATPK